jgi:hypothetical protein
VPSTFGKVTSEIKCTSCAEKGPHEAVFTAKPIQHFRCPACMATDVYLLEKPEGTEKRSKAKAVLQDHAALIDRRGSREASPYSTTKPFSEGGYVEHPTFGVGYIVDVLGPPPKMRVVFSDKKRLLVCGLPMVGERQKKDREAQRAPTPKPPPKASGGKRARRSRKAGVSESTTGPTECPVCKQIVNAFNLHRAPDGSIVGCMRCQ